MAGRSQGFELVADELERASGLGRAAARSALRGALARALFNPREVTASQLRMVVERVLPGELRRAGAKDAESLCARIAAGLASEGFGAADPESPDEIFGRMIRR
jgi:hypothetical protein